MEDNIKLIVDDIKIEEMIIEDIDEVFEVEKNCFEDYWLKEFFRKELFNEVVRYIVVKLNGKIVGYVGIWFIFDEGYINNVVVYSDYRGKKIGDKLIKGIVDLCKDNNIVFMILEVRVLNKIV